MMISQRSRILLAGVACTIAVVALPFPARSEAASPAAILQQLKSFRQMGSVLYVAAHPDDENTLLIAYLARGKDYRTAYLSMTRGDGGQNVLGPDFGEKLGVIRTEELLAARRLDGGRQFFTRAIDFGYSKDYRETLRIWDRQEALSDVVRVIREFRPDVVITRFSPIPGHTHGHHTASAVLALEAFKVAGDTNAFPEQHLAPWQPKRIFVNGRRGSGASEIHLEISGKDPVLNISFNELAARSRAMHKTQGFDNFRFGGGDGPRTETFELLAGEPATNDIMDGVDTTWNRVPGGAEIGTMADEIITDFDPQNPSASVNALLKLKQALAGLKPEPLVEEKRKLLDQILQNCLGLSVATTMPHAEVVPGENLELRFCATVTSGIPVYWRGMGFPDKPDQLSDLRKFVRVKKTGGKSVTNEWLLAPNHVTTQQMTFMLPANTPLTQPYWLREEPTAGMFQVADTSLIGRPENPPPFPVEYIFRVGDQTLAVSDVPVQAGTESGPYIARRTLKVIPPVSLDCENQVALFTPGSTHEVSVDVLAARSDVSGELSLDAPAGWRFVPTEQSFHFASVGDHKKFSFNVTAPSQIETAQITARARIGNTVYDNQRIELRYSHIPEELLQPPARIKALSLDFAARGKRVGYIPGAGDTVADAIRQMGCDVTLLGGDDLTTNRLKDFDSVVIGVRAFDVRKDLAEHMPALFDFVKSGGNLIEQYNRPGRDVNADEFTPYSLQLSGDRVTDEAATMTFLAPDHPVLNTPNKITQADFDGWVQERGIYFPDKWDDHFTPILACHDPGESPLEGGLLVAPYGKGHVVYTGLVFFRELPAGVPGAYRLFANLISLGK